jgi:hypothetical protein
MVGLLKQLQLESKSLLVKTVHLERLVCTVVKSDTNSKF